MFADIAASLRKLHALTATEADPAGQIAFRALRTQLALCVVFLLGAQFLGGHLWIAGCAALSDGDHRAALRAGWQATLAEEQRLHALLLESLENPGRANEPLPVSWLAAIGPDGLPAFERGDAPGRSAAKLLDPPLRRALLEITALKVRDFAQDRADSDGDPTAAPADNQPLLWHYFTALDGGRPYLLSMAAIRDAQGFPVREGMRLAATDLEQIALRVERQLHLHPIEIRGAAAWLPALNFVEISLAGFREDETYYARLTPQISQSGLARTTLHALLAVQLVLALFFIAFALPMLYVRMITSAPKPAAQTDLAQPDATQPTPTPATEAPQPAVAPAAVDQPEPEPGAETSAGDVPAGDPADTVPTTNNASSQNADETSP